MNFKGIMLCTRPLSSSALNLQKSNAWNCKKVQIPVGIGTIHKKVEVFIHLNEKLINLNDNITFKTPGRVRTSFTENKCYREA